jgi:hypothetical protein
MTYTAKLALFESHAVDCGRESGHGNIDANDPNRT